jgi:integrase
MNCNVPIEMTLADGLRWLNSAPLPAVQKRDLESAINTLSRWCKKPLSEMQLNPADLRREFAVLSPGGIGVKKKTLSNVKSRLATTLDLIGRGSRKAHKAKLSVEWQTFLNNVGDRYSAVLLRRFGRYCSSLELQPSQVCDRLLVDFLHSLKLDLSVNKPRRAHRETIRLWNRYAPRSGLQGNLSLPSYTNAYCLPWSAFPQHLVDDVESYLTQQATNDPFDLSAPLQALKPSSINTYRDRLRRFASCVVLGGLPPERLASLRDLVRPEVIDCGLRYLVNGRDSKYLAGTIATLLATIARDRVGLAEPEVKQIVELASRLKTKNKGLSKKVRERLHPLKHEPNLARLFLFPIAVLRGLTRKRDITKSDAYLFERVLALAILTVCPLRIGSLCSLRLDRHLRWTSGHMKGDLSVEFAEGELKNDEPASFPIPKEVADYIRVYYVRFRPLVKPPKSPFLFSGRTADQPKGKGGMSTQLRLLVFERLGLWVFPHIFRHVVHLVILRRFPGAYAMVARVLTHRSVATTIKNYAHFDAEISMRAYQRLVTEAQSGGGQERFADASVVAYALEREGPVHVRT